MDSSMMYEIMGSMMCMTSWSMDSNMMYEIMGSMIDKIMGNMMHAQHDV